MTEPAQALSIGAVIGGSTPQNARWEVGIVNLTRRIIAARGDITVPLNVNVVFHVPGDILQPEFVGVRSGSFRKRDSLLMIQAAVPADEPEDVDGALMSLLFDAIDEAERWALGRRVAHDLEALRALISTVATMPRAAVATGGGALVGRSWRHPDPQRPDIRALVAGIKHAIDDADLARITEAVRAAPRAPEVLAALARVRDPEVRGFVPRAAREILGQDAVPLLLRLVDDPDPDIRVMAIDELEALDPALLAPLVTKLRRRIARMTDDTEILAIGWTLVRLRDPDAIPLLEAHRARHEPWTWQAKAAEVQVLALRDPAAVVERIRAHDHDRMVWLPYAATIIGTPEAIAAVRACATDAPDEDCRRDCAYVLQSAGAQSAAERPTADS